MAWNRFQYWRRGKSVPPFIRKKPKGFSGSLLEYQLKKGMYRPSPYLQMIEKEREMLDEEALKYWEEYPNSSQLDFQQWYRERKAVYNKRIFKLKDEHWEFDKKRMKVFREQLYKTFGDDKWEETLAVCEGDEMDFYQTYKKLVKENG